MQATKPVIAGVVPKANSATAILTGICRLSFANVIVPAENLNGELRYSCTLLIDPTDPVIPMMKAAMKHAATEKWGDKIPAGLRNPLRDGNEKEYDGYEGMTFVNISSTNKPGVVDAATKPITDPSEVYSGCWVRADINCFAYSQKGNVGVSFGLNNIQKLADGPAFSGRKPADQVFGAVVSEGNPFDNGTGAAVPAAAGGMFD